MRHTVTWAAATFIAYLAETCILSRTGTVMPDLLLILVVSCGFLHGKRAGMLEGFFAGLLLDLFFGETIGLTALLYLILGYISGRLCGIYFEQYVRVPVLVSFAGSLAVNFIIYFLGFFSRGRIRIPAYFLRLILPKAALTALVCIIVYKLTYLVHHRLDEAVRSRKHTTWLKD
ncbi:MAG: rod shape-determining protein MreD [Lachnospiraceae bacterium]|nr:rod shape-determining protein MreD [Lachnospiraceae bacterium]